jgi:hypothetical protein
MNRQWPLIFEPSRPPIWRKRRLGDEQLGYDSLCLNNKIYILWEEHVTVYSIPYHQAEPPTKPRPVLL